MLYCYQSLDNSDDEFYGSDSDEFFTPPQSPLQEMLDDSDIKFEYDNFIYGYVVSFRYPTIVLQMKTNSRHLFTGPSQQKWIMMWSRHCTM